jgi:hypothetical protein
MSSNHELGDPEERGGVGEDFEPEEQGNEGEDDDSNGYLEELHSDDEEEESDDEEEESGEEEEESNEDDDGDLDAIVDNIAETLEDNARNHGALWIDGDDDDLNLVGLMSELTDQGMETLMEALKESSGSRARWGRFVTTIFVDVAAPAHNTEVALRITKILDCLNLSSLEDFSLEESNYEGPLHAWKPLVVDQYVTWMATTTSITRPDRLSSFHLAGLGCDPKVWDGFVARFSSIEEMRMTLEGGAGQYPSCALHAAALAVSMQRLPQLRKVFLRVRGTRLSSILSSLGRGLASLRKLEEVALHYLVNDIQDSDLSLDAICQGLAFSSSLKEVFVWLSSGANTQILFDRLRLSGSIKKVTLRQVDIIERKQAPCPKAIHGRAEKHLDCAPAWKASESSFRNQSITSLVLDHCSIGSAYSSSFETFMGVKDVSMIVGPWQNPDGQLPWSCPQKWSMLFQAHPHLTSFVVGQMEYRYASIVDEGVLAALVAGLSVAKSLQDLAVCTNSRSPDGPDVPLPSLEHLLRKCTGKLTLQHDGGISDSNPESICAGLRAAPLLKNLHLTLTGVTMTQQTVASILQSLQANRTVKTFHGRFLLYSPLDVGVLDSVLADLFASNSVLESFCLEPLSRRSDGQGDSILAGNKLPNYAEAVVAPIARALAHNRSLKVLCLNGLGKMDPGSFALLFGMLKSNVALERIEIPDGVEDSVATDTIEWLLTLNRYKRRCLVQKSDPTYSQRLLSGDVRDPRPARGSVPSPAGDPESLPAGVWSSVLERIAADRRADVMYHFLRRMPKSLFVSSDGCRGHQRA